MARNPVRDERQGDLFGAPLPPVKPTLRTSLPKPAREEMRAVKPVPLGALGELAYLAIEATRLVKRRLARGRGGDFGRKALAEGDHPSTMRFAGSGAS
jgi:hypothetical protein